MKFSIIICALSALVGASALLVPRQVTFPPCSQMCLATASLGSCQQGDDTCLCNTPAFVSSTADCIAASCTGSDLTEADQAAEQLCLAVGVKLTVTVSSTATSAASSASASSTATSSASTTTSSSSSSNGAISNGANTLAALAAFGLVAAITL
ncbi:hypothetical protein BT96DRAFT_1015561 [Gymnopus androsaceus JB14]|uniref:CFEM domain-containing protein n=1 Tax=Gymnopus androsaceus JB14 TaxID=1447944 RepID=A0A6A4IA65_9AGAR|nr:hypothetical protein BT96DRAFT_1015561 [Gymnopus androsaceus JB14]